MNINRFTKLKDGQYKILLEDNSSIIIHEDLILKYDLLIQKRLDDELKEEILQENLNYIAYSLALKYISIRMRSIKEIYDYLDKKGVNSEIIEESVKLLLKNGYLNDTDFAKAFIVDKLNLSNDGPYKIMRELELKGVDESIINKCILVFEEDMQYEKCCNVVLKLSKTNRNKSVLMLKKKIVEYLINLGYDKRIINRALEKLEVKNNGDIKKKEYDKLYKKLSKKYSGKELEYKIKQKMYALGFNNDEF